MYSDSGSASDHAEVSGDRSNPNDDSFSDPEVPLSSSTPSQRHKKVQRSLLHDFQLDQPSSPPKSSSSPPAKSSTEKNVKHVNKVLTNLQNQIGKTTFCLNNPNN